VGVVTCYGPLQNLELRRWQRGLGQVSVLTDLDGERTCSGGGLNWGWDHSWIRLKEDAMARLGELATMSQLIYMDQDLGFAGLE
jgi:hypothetical protein